MYTINGAILFAVLIGKEYIPRQNLECNKFDPTDYQKNKVFYITFFNRQKSIGSKIVAVRKTIHRTEITECEPICKRLKMSSSLIFQQFQKFLLLCNYAFIIFLRLWFRTTDSDFTCTVVINLVKVKRVRVKIEHSYFGSSELLT